MANLKPVYALMIGAVLAASAGCTTSTRKGTEPPNIADRPGGTNTRPGANSFGDSTRLGWSAVPNGTNRPVPNGLQSSSQHANTRMEMNPYLADHVAAMEEVRSARVAVTDSNAYVAVQLEPNASGTETNGLGTVPQRVAGNTAGAGLPGAWRTGPSDPANEARRGGLTSGIAGNSYDVNNAARGLAGMTDANSDMNDRIKAKIVDRVRSLSSPALQHVYVSSHPDFFQRMSVYTEQAKNGLPLAGWVQELNTMAQRIFPTSNQTGAYGGSWSSGAPGRDAGSVTGDTLVGSQGWRSHP